MTLVNSDRYSRRNRGQIAAAQDGLVRDLEDGRILVPNSDPSGVFRFTPMTSSQRDALTPSDGMVIYNSTTNKLQVRAAGVWVDLH